MLSVSMPNSATFGGVGRYRHEMTGNRLRVAQLGDEPVPGRGGVGDRLQGGERLGTDDEQRSRRVEVVGRFPDVTAVDVRHEPALDVPVAVVEQSLVGHGRTEVGAADTDVDDRGDRLAGVAAPLAVPDLVGEAGHAVEDLVNVGDDVVAVGGDDFGGGSTQGDMEDGAVFGDVDVFAGPHGVDPLPKSGPLGHRDQKADGLLGQAVLGVVEVQVGGVEGERVAAARIVGEEVPQVDVRQFAVVVEQGLPFRGRGDAHGGDRHGGSLPDRSA